jgi:hypothetical protein
MLDVASANLFRENKTKRYRFIKSKNKAIQGNTRQINSRQFKAIQGNSRQFKANQGNTRQFNKAIQGIQEG